MLSTAVVTKHQNVSEHDVATLTANGNLPVVKSNSMDADRPLFIAHGLPSDASAHGEILTSLIVQFGAGAGSSPATQR